MAAADDIIINLHIYSLCLVTGNWRSNIDLVLEIHWPCPNITTTNAKITPAFSFCTRFRPPARAGDGTPPLIHVTLISTKPLFQFIWCSTYWIQVLIYRLHQFFRKFRKIFGSLRPSLTFFRQIRTLSPVKLQFFKYMELKAIRRFRRYMYTT